MVTADASARSKRPSPAFFWILGAVGLLFVAALLGGTYFELALVVVLWLSAFVSVARIGSNGPLSTPVMVGTALLLGLVFGLELFLGIWQASMGPPSHSSGMAGDVTAVLVPAFVGPIAALGVLAVGWLRRRPFGAALRQAALVGVPLALVASLWLLSVGVAA